MSTVPAGIQPHAYVHTVTHKQPENVKIITSYLHDSLHWTTCDERLCCLRESWAVHHSPLLMHSLCSWQSNVYIWTVSFCFSWRHTARHEFLTRVCSESSFALWTSESSFSMRRGKRNCKIATNIRAEALRLVCLGAKAQKRKINK